MSDAELIEKVAKLAGWHIADRYSSSDGRYRLNDGVQATGFINGRMCVEDSGTLALIKELLAAGYTLGRGQNIFEWFDNPFKDEAFSVCDFSLEKATMRAYVAWKEGTSQ